MWRLLRILHPALPALLLPGEAIIEKDGDGTRGTALFQAKCRESLGDIAASNVVRPHEMLLMEASVDCRTHAGSAQDAGGYPMREPPHFSICARGKTPGWTALAPPASPMRVVLTDCATTLRLVLSGDTGPLRGVPMNLSKE